MSHVSVLGNATILSWVYPFALMAWTVCLHRIVLILPFYYHIRYSVALCLFYRNDLNKLCHKNREWRQSYILGTYRRQMNIWSS